MRRSLIVATTAGAVLVAGLLAVPALAATGAGPGRGATATCPVSGLPMGAGPGTGRGPGAGTPGGARNGMGHGMGSGMGYGTGMRPGSASDPLAGLARGTLTDQQKQVLAATAEEEKLAHDVYAALAGPTGDARFTRIADAETRHLAAVRALLTRYGVGDPTAGKAGGAFATASVQQRYQDLVARGSASRDAALGVGRDVENADLADLGKARTGLTAPDALAVYGRLAMASQMHLRAFGG